MGKFVDKATAEKVGKAFLESFTPFKSVSETDAFKTKR